MIARNLIAQSVIAISVSQIKTSVGVQVLNHKLETGISRAGTHGFGLAGCEVAGEHAAVVVAGVVDEGEGFVAVGEGRSGGVASGRGQSDKGGEGGEGGENGDLHFDGCLCRLG